MAGKLVGFDTTSRESNLKAIEFVRNWLDGLGIGSEMVDLERLIASRRR